MRSTQKLQLGMVCAGAVSRTTAGTHPAILDRLGPVKAASLRVASRAANTMRAGVPVSSYEDLATAQAIVISAPDGEAPAIVADLAKATLRWKHKVVILADSQLDCTVLKSIAVHGAAVGCFNMLPEFGNRRFLMEGDRKALGVIRSLLESPDCKGIEIDRGTKSRYFAALGFLGFSLTAMLIAGSETLRRVGMHSVDIQSAVEGTTGEAVRTYLKAGRNALANIDTTMFREHLASLRATDPDLAEYYRELLETTRKFRPGVL